MDNIEKLKEERDCVRKMDNNEIFQAFKQQAAHAIDQDQSLVDFVAHCHPNNRSIARKAYREMEAHGSAKSDAEIVLDVFRSEQPQQVEPPCV